LNISKSYFLWLFRIKKKVIKLVLKQYILLIITYLWDVTTKVSFLMVTCCYILWKAKNGDLSFENGEKKMEMQCNRERRVKSEGWEGEREARGTALSYDLAEVLHWHWQWHCYCFVCRVR